MHDCFWAIVGKLHAGIEAAARCSRDFLDPFLTQ